MKICNNVTPISQNLGSRGILIDSLHTESVSTSSDEMLLREMRSCVTEWTEKATKALASGNIEEYNYKKNQVR